MGPFLGKSRVIDDLQPPAQASLGHHVLHPEPVHLPVVPLGVGKEFLQPLAVGPGYPSARSAAVLRGMSARRPVV